MIATLIRNRHVYCCGVRLDVFLNGKKVASLKNGEQTQLDLPQEGGKVEVRMGNFATAPPLQLAAAQREVVLEAGAKTWPLFDFLALSYLRPLQDKVLYLRLRSPLEP